MALRVTEQQLEEYRRKGLVPPLPPDQDAADDPVPVAFLPDEIIHASDNVLRFSVGIKTAAEVNARGWRGTSARTKEARDRITKLLGRNLRLLVPFSEAFHRGDTLCVSLTRCGGRKLDKLANLGSALKHAEDAVALMMGANDGADNWRAEAFQTPGGPVGVVAIIHVLSKTV